MKFLTCLFIYQLMLSFSCNLSSCRTKTLVGFPFSPDSPFLHTFSKAMHKLRSHGILDEIDRKYATPHKSCKEPYVSKISSAIMIIEKPNNESTFFFQTDLGFEQTAFPFMCLVFGMALSLTMTLCEKAHLICKRNKLPTHQA